MDKKNNYSAPLYKHSELTEKIIGAFYAVYSALGYGFLENVYVKALIIELKRRGLTVNDELPIHVYYLGELIGEYYADIVVNELIILEIKAVKALATEHEAQLLNYLKATPYEVGLLLNFGPKPETKRRSFDNSRKEWWIAKNKS
ncbi:MAG TPA: GxxExxY protein [Anaerolineales bacterium]|jgi:GxxExxY protein|nr:GxxExxY protein [Anaerolineales bacterium]HQX15346.1 GxxExxY protein [Anaerolineales bacterium]